MTKPPLHIPQLDGPDLTLSSWLKLIKALHATHGPNARLYIDPTCTTPTFYLTPAPRTKPRPSTCQALQNADQMICDRCQFSWPANATTAPRCLP